MDNSLDSEILIYEDGRIIVTAAAFSILEIKNILDKYGTDADPYLAYVHLMTYIKSPYRSADIKEKKENIIYEVINTIGDFDPEDPLLDPAVEKLTILNSTPLLLFFQEIEQELHRMRNYLKDNEITDETLSNRFKVLKEAGSIVASYTKTKIAAEEEMKIKGRGKSQIGDY